MPQKQLRAVNLNLLPILRELLRTRNVTRAAERLHLSQPAVSEALARLRVQFEDELLVKVGREMQLTSLAIALAPRLEQSLQSIEDLVQPEQFTPAELRRKFLVATADTVILVLGSGLLEQLVTVAPNASVQFVDLQHLDMRGLKSGEVDLMILPQGLIDTDDLRKEFLYVDEFVCIARKRHPSIRGRLTKKLYDALPHVAYQAYPHSKFSVEVHLLGRDQHDLLRLCQFTLLPFLVERSEAIALVQRRVAERFAKYVDIQILEPPFRLPAVEVCAYWSRIHDRDRAHAWFRALVHGLVKA